MSLTSSLLIGQSALSASQIALQVTGNNLANLATVGYHRQTIGMNPIAGQRIGGNTFIGRGVSISDIRRQIDPAIQARLRDSISQEASAYVDLEVLGQVESILNELTGSDLSSGMTDFFNAFSELANNPGANVTAATAIEQGAALAARFRDIRQGLTDLRLQVEDQLRFHVRRADELLGEIASLNEAIIGAEGGGSGQDGALRDQRDLLIDELSALIDIDVIEREGGGVDILVDSNPVVIGSNSRGLEMEFRSVNGVLEARVQTKSDPERINVSGGRIGGLYAQREAVVKQTMEDLDEVASNLIFEVNRRHALGRPPIPLTEMTAQLTVPAGDQTLAMNDPDNETFAGLPFQIEDGVMVVAITDQNGIVQRTEIPIDLDGINNAGDPGFEDDMTLEDLRAALDGVANLNAEILPSGQLRLTTDPGFDVSFDEDSSGALAVLGMNSFFTGTGADDIAVRSALQEEPGLLSIGLTDGSNETVLAIAGLRDVAVSGLSGATVQDAWLESVERLAVQTASASTRSTALSTVRQSLEAQEASVGGVSADEESINLINYQQQYQGAARFISVVDELTQVLFSLV